MVRHYLDAEGHIRSHMAILRCPTVMSPLGRVLSAETVAGTTRAIACEHARGGGGRCSPMEQTAGSGADVIAARGILINAAYRLLGSIAEAEDIAQETYMRWYRLTTEQRALIVSPEAWCVRVAKRITLDVLKSARSRHERNIDPWSDEPVAGSSADLVPTSVDPADAVIVDESIVAAMHLMLESMTPSERVPFVLHEVFQYSYAEIGEIVGRSAAACRQLATSARRRVSLAPRPSRVRGERADRVHAIKAALERVDVPTLVGLLDPRLATDHGWCTELRSNSVQPGVVKAPSAA